MATTKLWHIQGRLKDLVDYVENPEKTVKPGLQDFFNVFSYTQNPDKTAGGQFVTAINCQKDIALQQMILTKQGGRLYCVAWLPKLQAGRGHARAVSCSGCGIGTTDVGRSVSGHCYNPLGQESSAQPLLHQLRILQGWRQVQFLQERVKASAGYF